MFVKACGSAIGYHFEYRLRMADVRLFPATIMPDRDWWHALWPDPEAVLRTIGRVSGGESWADCVSGTLNPNTSMSCCAGFPLFACDSGRVS